MAKDYQKNAHAWVHLICYFLRCGESKEKWWHPAVDQAIYLMIYKLTRENLFPEFPVMFCTQEYPPSSDKIRQSLSLLKLTGLIEQITPTYFTKFKNPDDYCLENSREFFGKDLTKKILAILPEIWREVEKEIKKSRPQLSRIFDQTPLDMEQSASTPSP
ncbi:MAG: hypothetical protein PHS07_02150 [Patescibacteria group bacterium]|nr:hypothetical protein [Patescibacteria group bacterium]